MEQTFCQVDLRHRFEAIPTDDEMEDGDGITY